MSGEILVATSIAPGPRLALQQEAIASWQTCGLDIISLNTRAEIALLQPSFPAVEFVAAPRTAQPFTGKPLIFISDMLHELATRQHGVVGIVNSDVQIAPGLVSFLAAACTESMLVGPRLNVDAWDDPAGAEDPWGFDLFLFERAMIGVWPESRFCLGQGFWDIWLPLMAILRGRPVRKIRPPIVRHIRHETQRDDSFFLFADEFATSVAGYIKADGFGAELDRRTYIELRGRVSGGDTAALEPFARHIDELTRHAIRFIDRSAVSITPPGAEARSRSPGVPISMKRKSPA
jgi:hypothetical protein